MIKKGYLEKSYSKNKGKGVKPICFFLIMAPNLFIFSILISSLLIFFK